MITTTLPPGPTLLQPQVEANVALNLPGLASLDTRLPPVALMPVEAIQVRPNGHGEMIDVEGLTASIQEHGILQPLIVAPDGRLLAGRRRLEAARQAGLAMVPVRVYEIATERAAIEISLIENVERADLDPLTKAKCYRGLIEQGAEAEEIAALVGQESSHVYQHLALLELHPAVQQAVEQRTLSFADARTFAKLEPQDQATVFEEIQGQRLHQENPKPISSRQIKLRVDMQRVLRLAQASTASPEKKQVEPPKGNYAALFEREDNGEHRETEEPRLDPLRELNALVANMIAASQGEDQVRGWARRLSRILKALQEEAATRGSNVVQARLWSGEAK